ncbi:enoyl-CoA hydratase [Evansella sp. AB-rgal1]|uniref:enoyl-CoA hydratase n=1 Tax=Evansella sp. AB-rgal1 TaxID=3242696 RepID=UPI00359D0464
MDRKYVTCSMEKAIAIVSLNHQPANSLTQEMIKEIGTLFDELALDDNVKVVVLLGEGRFFAAGADIKEFTKVTESKVFQNMSRTGQLVFNKIEAFTKPVISVIHGAALGGGLELAMATHIRFVAENAKLGLPELQLGLIPGFGGTYRLQKLVGSRALELILTSNPISGVEAVELGLANRAFPEDVLLEESMKVANILAKKGKESVARTLDLFLQSREGSLEDILEKEAVTFGEMAVTENAKEGISAFMEKRKPNFK